jgi:hypothetical protein
VVLGPTKFAVLLGVYVCGCALNGFADSVLLKTDATWRTINGSATIPANWNSSAVFDDSDQAGWMNSFKSPAGDHIWNTSNLSSESPANPRFRHVFSLYGTITNCVGHFYFDDNGTVWINGVQVLNDTGGGATTFNNVILDPSLFHAGDNLIAVWGHNTSAPYNNIEVDITFDIVAPRPAILINDRFGVQSGNFGFDISASTGQTITVEASTNLSTWFPLATNTMTGPILHLLDPQFSTRPNRFYRLRSP